MKNFCSYLKLSNWRYKIIRNRGSSLLEVSFVLFIMAILASFSLSLTNFLKESKLTKIYYDFVTYERAYNKFYEKYSAIAGDMKDVRILGDEAENFSGNGNGVIDSLEESFYAWKHLNFADLISGNFNSSEVVSYIPYDKNIQGNIPPGPLNGGYSFDYISTAYSAIDYGAVIFADQINNAVATYPILTPIELLFLDKKFDDGNPTTGKIIANNSLVTTNICFTNQTYETNDTKACYITYVIKYKFNDDLTISNLVENYSNYENYNNPLSPLASSTAFSNYFSTNENDMFYKYLQGCDLLKLGGISVMQDYREKNGSNYDITQDKLVYNNCFARKCGDVYEGQTKKLACPPGYNGYVLASCGNGTMRYDSYCSPNQLGTHCSHQGQTINLPCPLGQYGTKTLYCNSFNNIYPNDSGTNYLLKNSYLWELNVDTCTSYNIGEYPQIQTKINCQLGDDLQTETSEIYKGHLTINKTIPLNIDDISATYDYFYQEDTNNNIPATQFNLGTITCLPASLSAAGGGVDLETISSITTYSIGNIKFFTLPCPSGYSGSIILANKNIINPDGLAVLNPQYKIYEYACEALTCNGAAIGSIRVSKSKTCESLYDESYIGDIFDICYYNPVTNSAYWVESDSTITCTKKICPQLLYAEPNFPNALWSSAENYEAGTYHNASSCTNDDNDDPLDVHVCAFRKCLNSGSWAMTNTTSKDFCITPAENNIVEQITVDYAVQDSINPDLWLGYYSLLTEETPGNNVCTGGEGIPPLLSPSIATYNCQITIYNLFHPNFSSLIPDASDNDKKIFSRAYKSIRNQTYCESMCGTWDDNSICNITNDADDIIIRDFITAISFTDELEAASCPSTKKESHLLYYGQYNQFYDLMTNLTYFTTIYLVPESRDCTELSSYLSPSNHYPNNSEICAVRVYNTYHPNYTSTDEVRKAVMKKAYVAFRTQVSCENMCGVWHNGFCYAVD